MASDAAAISVLDHLRATTAAAHQRLENATGLGVRTISRARLRAALAAFHGFHVEWEPAVAAVLKPPFSPHRRLPALRDDLLAMGLSRASVDRLPRCSDAVRLGRSFESALGSMYVMEGSTLGGKVIARTLRRSPEISHVPAYFDPYGDATGRRWQAFCRSLCERTSGPATRKAVTEAALATFDILERWMQSTTEEPIDGRSSG